MLHIARDRTSGLRILAIHPTKSLRRARGSSRTDPNPPVTDALRQALQVQRSRCGLQPVSDTSMNPPVAAVAAVAGCSDQRGVAGASPSEGGRVELGRFMFPHSCLS